MRRYRVGDVLALKRREVPIDSLTEYRLIGVYSFGKGIFHREPKLGAELGNYRFFSVEPGDLVVSNIQAWEGAVGVAAERDAECIGTHRFLTYVPSDDSVDTNYLRYFFLSEAGSKLIQKASPGSVTRNRTLSIDRFADLEIQVPDIHEQRRIANELDRLLGKLQELRTLQRGRQPSKSLLDSAVRETFEKLSAGSEMQLGSDIQIVGGATPARDDSTCWDGDVIWITPTDLGALRTRDIRGSARTLSTHGYATCSAQLVPSGSVVMSSRAPIGHLGIARTKLCTNQGCKTLVAPPEVLPEFLYFGLRAMMDEIKAVGSGTTFHEVSIGKLAGFTIPYVDYAVQRRVIDRLDSVENAVSELSILEKSELARIDALGKSALNHALSNAF